MHVLLQSLSPYLYHYGGLALFILLALGIIGLPIPEETMMIFAGYLIANGKWGGLSTILVAISGSIVGISTSYIIGLTAGNYWLKKYGYLIGITEDKLKKVDKWFDGIGKWSLPVGYFIIGVRHFTGYMAGATRMPYKKFALYAYSGAIVWSITFISIGYFFNTKIDFLLTFLYDYERAVL